LSPASIKWARGEGPLLPFFLGHRGRCSSRRDSDLLSRAALIGRRDTGESPNARVQLPEARGRSYECGYGAARLRQLQRFVRLGHFVVKKITTGGTFRFQNRLLYLANAMVDQLIGLEETDDGIWSIYFNTILLATFDERGYIITG
jgi:hypothetical protein